MKPWIQSAKMLLFMAVLTGLAYPLAVTLAAKLFFPAQAGGSLVTRDGKTLGSSLLAQKTEDPRYFWPRPSAGDYATVASGASNLGPTSAVLKKAFDDRGAALRQAQHLGPDAPVPADLLFASGSGLDPHISPEAARFQVARVAAARRFDAARTAALAALVEKRVEGPQWGLFGDPRVNVLALNLDLDTLK